MYTLSAQVQGVPNTLIVITIFDIILFNHVKVVSNIFIVITIPVPLK